MRVSHNVGVSVGEDVEADIFPRRGDFIAVEVSGYISRSNLEYSAGRLAGQPCVKISLHLPWLGDFERLCNQIRDRQPLLSLYVEDKLDRRVTVVGIAGHRRKKPAIPGHRTIGRLNVFACLAVAGQRPVSLPREYAAKPCNLPLRVKCPAPSPERPPEKGEFVHKPLEFPGLGHSTANFSIRWPGQTSPFKRLAFNLQPSTFMGK